MPCIHSAGNKLFIDEHLGVSKEEHGIFVYRATVSVAVRTIPSVDDDCRTTKDILPQDLVAVDLKKYDEFPDWISSHGPFLRLADRSGWGFERKDCKRVLVEVPTKRGLWAMRVASETGLLLRRHPSHRYDLVVQPEKLFPHHLVVWADIMVESNGHTFVHVQGTNGWLFATQGAEFIRTLICTTSQDRNLEQDVSVYLPPSLPTSTTASTTSSTEFTVDAVRRIAKEHGYTELQFNESYAVISFLREANVQTRAYTDTRVCVYYTTGTISLTIDHPQSGKSQFFRWKCSLAELAETFQNPRPASCAGAEGDHGNASLQASSQQPPSTAGNLRGTFGEDPRNIQGTSKEQPSIQGTLRELSDSGTFLSDTDTVGGPEETTLREALRGVDDAIGDLLKQRSKLLEGVRGFECKRERQLLYSAGVTRSAALMPPKALDIVAESAVVESDVEEGDVVKELDVERDVERDVVRDEYKASSSRTSLSTSRSSRDVEPDVELEALYSMLSKKKSMEYTKSEALLAMRRREGDKCLFFGSQAYDVGERFSDRVTCMAMAETATLLIYDTGDPFFTPGLTSSLYKTLKKWSGRGDQQGATYVAMGSHDRYFAQRADGTLDWEGGSDEFDEAAKQVIKSDQSFGIVKVAFGQRATSYFILQKQGTGRWRDIPEKMVQKIRLAAQKRIQTVALGPKGEWFVSWKNGSFEYDQVSPQMDGQINKLLNEGWHVRDMAFGDDSTYLIRYGPVGGRFA